MSSKRPSGSAAPLEETVIAPYENQENQNIS